MAWVPKGPISEVIVASTRELYDSFDLMKLSQIKHVHTHPYFRYDENPLKKMLQLRVKITKSFTREQADAYLRTMVSRIKGIFSDFSMRISYTGDQYGKICAYPVSAAQRRFMLGNGFVQLPIDSFGHVEWAKEAVNAVLAPTAAPSTQVGGEDPAAGITAAEIIERVNAYVTDSLREARFNGIEVTNVRHQPDGSFDYTVEIAPGMAEHYFRASDMSVFKEGVRPMVTDLKDLRELIDSNPVELGMPTIMIHTAGKNAAGEISMTITVHPEDHPLALRIRNASKVVEIDKSAELGAADEKLYVYTPNGPQPPSTSYETP